MASITDEGRDAYDVRGRTAHESIFNMNDGNYRCPNSQQGYSPFSTWTRGLAWAICGFAEELEFLEVVANDSLEGCGGRKVVRAMMLEAATATADFYLANACADGVPMWDTGAPDLHRLGDYLGKPSDPFNAWEPVDSSAAAIAAQGLVRLGNYLRAQGDNANGDRYRQAGLTVAKTLFGEPYLSTDVQAPGAAAAFRLPPPEWLGLHRARPESSQWRKLHVGRLPCARTGPAHRARGQGRSVSNILSEVMADEASGGETRNPGRWIVWGLAFLVVAALVWWGIRSRRGVTGALPGGSVIQFLGTSVGLAKFTTEKRWHQWAKKVLPAPLEDWVPTAVSWHVRGFKQHIDPLRSTYRAQYRRRHPDAVEQHEGGRPGRVSLSG